LTIERFTRSNVFNKLGKPNAGHLQVARWIRIDHCVVYRFDVPRQSCALAARLEPRRLGAQKLHAADIRVSPAPIDHARAFDAWGNAVDHFSLDGPLHNVRISSSSLLEISEVPGTGVVPEPQYFAIAARAEATRRNGAIWRWAAQWLPDEQPSPQDVQAICRFVRRDFAYDPAATSAARPVEEIFAACRGVCQDFASLVIAVLRARGMTCRFNTGYLLQGLSRVPRMVASHAWISVWFDGHGWLDFDPVAPGIPKALLATGPTQADIHPVAGSSMGPPARQSLQVEIAINLAAPGEAIASSEGVS
jgi:transglutaminase-like putative cysteine protease